MALTLSVGYLAAKLKGFKDETEKLIGVFKDPELNTDVVDLVDSIEDALKVKFRGLNLSVGFTLRLK
jgi:hypothetical protein